MKPFLFKDVLRWVVMFFVGVLTAFVACSIDITVEELCKLKFGLLRQLTDKGVAGINLIYFFHGISSKVLWRRFSFGAKSVFICRQNNIHV